MVSRTHGVVEESIWVRRLAIALAVGLGSAAAVGCDPDARGRAGAGGLGEGDVEENEVPVSEIQDGLDRPLSDAASYLRDDSNWIEPDDAMPASDDGADDGSGQDDGAAPEGATCAGHCGGLGSDEACYCDAECNANDDCCADYGQHCGGANDDVPPPPSGTCAGHCGGAGSDGACYCDAHCEANDDCCSDYGAQCGGDGGGGGAGSCVGHCGGAGSDGACYCDAVCGDNGDCCSDYVASCANGIAAGPAFDLAAGPRTAASGNPCWGVIADPVDVDQILQTAAGGAALFGGTCVAVVVVPAGAAAAPTAGVSVGAAALACSSAALGGSVGGAVTSLLSQKMGSIGQCSASVLGEVMRIFPWGNGEKQVPVPVFRQPADPGNCTPDEQQELQSEVNDVCKNAGTRRCSYADACETMAAKIEVSAQCIAARSKINSVCYQGGDGGHNTAIEQELNLQNNCHELSASSGC